MSLSQFNFSLNPGKLEPFVLDLMKKIIEQGQLPAILEAYIAKGEVDPSRFTSEVKQLMIDYILDRGITINDKAKLDAGEYDEYFALAYSYATETRQGGTDPVDSARYQQNSAIRNWDFTVDTFDDLEDQIKIAENIMCAGAVDYVFEMGERLGVFKIVDALVLNWSAGIIDIADGTAAAKLYRYLKLREERSSEEERGMLYKRVLNKGNVNVLSRMVINESFPQLWHGLMAEIADYIDKTEKLSEGISETSPVSKSRIYQAVRELQYNLTEFGTGMAHMQVREIYAQLQECMDILREPEIMAYFGGNRRKSVWTVIEELSRQEYKTSPKIGAFRSLAVDGNKVFQYIAQFDEATTKYDEFIELLLSAESYILNMSLIGESNSYAENSDYEDEFNDEFSEEDFNDDF